MLKLFKVMGKALSGELSYMRTGLVSSPVCISSKSYCITHGISIGSNVSILFIKILKFYCKVYVVMGKVLPGELSCM